MTLTPLQTSLFRRNGFLRLENCIPSDLLASLNQALTRDFAEPSGEVYRDDSGKLIKIYDLWARGEPYTTLIASPHLVEPLRCLVGPNIEFTRFRHNHAMVCAPGDAGTPHLHRDVFHWSHTVISVMVFLEDATDANGCTRLIPGSHYLPDAGIPQSGPGARITHDESLAHLAEQQIPIPVNAGGVLLFDGFVFHSIGRNTTNGTRRSLCLSYRAVDELDRRGPSPDCVVVAGEPEYRGWQ